MVCALLVENWTGWVVQLFFSETAPWLFFYSGRSDGTSPKTVSSGLETVSSGPEIMSSGPQPCKKIKQGNYSQINRQNLCIPDLDRSTHYNLPISPALFGGVNPSQLSTMSKVKLNINYNGGTGIEPGTNTGLSQLLKFSYILNFLR